MDLTYYNKPNNDIKIYLIKKKKFNFFKCGVFHNLLSLKLKKINYQK